MEAQSQGGARFIPQNPAELLEVWRESVVLDGFADPSGSVLHELSLYFDISVDEARDRCLHWVRDSVQEWEASARDTPEGLLDFYRTTQSWIFDTMWYHAQQYYGTKPAESVMIARRLAHLQPGRHLDYGAGVGSTSLFFQRLGWQVALADISASMQAFARWRFAQRKLDAEFYDLTAQELPADYFDVVTACDVMAHVPDPARTLRRIRRSLKPGGLLIFNVMAHPDLTGEYVGHLYHHSYPVLQPVRRIGFERLPRLEFFHVYRKVSRRTPARALAVQLYDAVRYNRLVSAGGDVKRAVARLR